MASRSRGRSPNKKNTQQFQLDVGDKVMALWPGSSLYYPAVVEEVGKGKYTVRFQNNSVSTLSAKNISVSWLVCTNLFGLNLKFNLSRSRFVLVWHLQSERNFRKKGSRSRSRSPSRRGRSRSRSRSPARQKVQKRTASPSPSRSTTGPSTPRKPRATTPVRRSTRMAASHSQKEPDKETEEETSAPSSSPPVAGPELSAAPSSGQRKGRYEFLGPIGVCFMMLGLPTTVIGLYLACSKRSCSIQGVTKVHLPSAGDLWDTQSFLVVLSWLALVAGLSLFKVGKVTWLHAFYKYTIVFWCKRRWLATTIFSSPHLLLFVVQILSYSLLFLAGCLRADFIRWNQATISCEW